MKKRDFLKKSSLFAAGTAVIPSVVFSCKEKAVKAADKVKDVIRTAHIGVGNMGAADLNDISSHTKVEVVALCDVDSNMLKAAAERHPKAKLYADYRKMLSDMEANIDAVIVSTPDHTHAPA